MSYENILIETHGKVGVIQLNRPKALNALNDQLMDELGEALLKFDADENVGCIIVTGSEKAFAAGADIGAMSNYTYMDAYKGNYITRNWEQIRNVRTPVIAAVAGYALGGGCELAMMCDFIIAADTAKFGQNELRYLDLKLFAVFGHTEVLSGHRTLRCSKGCPAGIFKLLSRRQERLVTDHAEAAHLLDMIISVCNNPMSRNQLRRHLASILDGNGISEHITGLIRLRLLRKILCIH